VIIAIIIGRKGSKGFPGKNTYKVFNKPLAEYSIDVAIKTPEIDDVFLSTDDEALKKIARKKNLKIIQRPKYLASNKALGEDAFLHAYNHIKKKEKKDIKYFVLLMCNSPTITSLQISKGIKILNKNTKIDSAVTVSKYNMYSPLRARKINDQGLLDPYLPFKYFGDEKNLNCDRDSQGDVWFADMGCSIVRPSCFDNISNGLLPQKWMGKKIYPIKQDAGLDIDYEWQLPQIKWWLDKNK
jgi:hypothetical protein